MEDEIARAILKYRSLGSLPENKLAALKGLEKLQDEVTEIIGRLKREQTLAFKNSTKAAFRHGINQGISELAMVKLPFYLDLKPDGIDKLATFDTVSVKQLYPQSGQRVRGRSAELFNNRLNLSCSVSYQFG